MDQSNIASIINHSHRISPEGSDTILGQSAHGDFHHNNNENILGPRIASRPRRNHYQPNKDMKKIHNFYAGPGKIPKQVLERIEAELIDYQGLGLSIMEISHRAQPVLDLLERTSEKIHRMLELDDDHVVLFLQGGGTMQFHMVPINLSTNHDPIDYVNTGYWSEKAIDTAKALGRDVHIAGCSHTSIPKELQIRSHAKYLHLCSNNTVAGTQWKEFPATNVPVIADMSSDLLSQKIDANKFGIIYAHAQKTIGAAGATVVIVSKSLLEKHQYDIPEFFSYRTHIAAGSNYHTPPVFAIYTIDCMLDWLENEVGGIEAMEAMNHKKASHIYQWLDQSALFNCPIDMNSRSLMNIVFDSINEEIGKCFSMETEKEGFLGLIGHRKRGGFRASLYNAVSAEDVSELVRFMHDFESRYG